MKGETKEGRFKRVATKRVQRVIDSLRSLSQCSNKRMYEWNDQQLTKMWKALDNVFEDCKAGYEKSAPDEFSL